MPPQVRHALRPHLGFLPEPFQEPRRPTRIVSARYSLGLIGAEQPHFPHQPSLRRGIHERLCPLVRPLHMSHPVLSERYSTQDGLWSPLLTAVALRPICPVVEQPLRD